MSETQKKVGYTAWGDWGGAEADPESNPDLSKKQDLLVSVTHTHKYTHQQMPNLLQDSSILLLMHAANLGMGALLCPAIPVAELRGFSTKGRCQVWSQMIF